MNVTTEKVAEGQVALTIEVEPEAVEKAKNQAYQRLVTKTIVPGFRKGKAPRAMLERYLGQGALLEEALQRLLPQVFNEAAKEQNITAFAEPKYEVVQVEPVIVKAVVDIPPEVELGSYQEVRASLDIPEVTDDDVSKTIERARESMATQEAVERPLEIDDNTTIDIRGTKDGTEFFTREDYPYSVRQENPVPVPGLVEHLVGMEKGGEKEFDMSFPEDHEDKTVAGHNYHFWVKVNDVKAKVLPPLDDEFAKKADEGVETMEELQRRVRERLATANEQRAKEELLDKIVGEVVDISKVEIPPSLVEREVHRIIDDEEERFRRQRFSLAQYLNLIGKTPEQYHEELHAPARERVKRSLVLGKVAEAESIEVDPSEVEAEIAVILQGSGGGTEELRRFFGTPMGQDAITQNLLTRKTLRKLVEIATEGAVSYPEVPQVTPAAQAEEPAMAEAEVQETAEAEAVAEALGEEPGTTEATEEPRDSGEKQE